MSKRVDPFTRTLSAVRISEGIRADAEELVVREGAVTILLNNRELATLLCSPVNLDYLAVGFLLSEGLLATRQQIKKLTVDEGGGTVWVETVEDRELDSNIPQKRIITSSSGRGNSLNAGRLPPVESEVSFSAGAIFRLVDAFQSYSEVYRSTHGVHSAALCDENQVLVFKEDIGRHNAIDKIFGECLLKGIPAEHRIVLISGRVSSEMLMKVARRNVPVVVSIAVPTDIGVQWAAAMNMTLVGRVKAGRMNIYSGAWRIEP